MFEPGRMCLKIAGRDAGKMCVIVKKIDPLFVMIDGETRRRKCNIRHLEPLEKVVDLNEDASREEVKTVFKKEFNIELKDTKPKKATSRTKKQHKKKVKPVKEKKVEKKSKKSVAKKTAPRKETPKTEETPVESLEAMAEVKAEDKKE
jgi:large subunit ribosomal protein L14e